MAECYFTQEMISEESQEFVGHLTFEMVPATDVMTGGADARRFLLYQLKISMLRAKRIDIIVSFLMESGVRMLLPDLKQALERGAEVRILTGNYLGITQPGALYLLKRELQDRVDLRFYNDPKRSFHPKAYIFHHEKESEIYIGSSNISRSALTSGIEWNYRFSNRKDPENFHTFYQTFEDLFCHHSVVVDEDVLREYSRAWKKPAVQKDLDQLEELTEEKVTVLFQPRGAQIEALYALEQTRAEGSDKALIYAATGVGKTLIAAFDSAAFPRVLFVAHREEILRQAADSFRNVRGSEDYGFFWGKEKCTDRSVIFASVSSLGKSTYLQEKYFTREYFDYIVVDEFHHAVNDQYRRILEYFKPRFMLGLTATPERMDGRSIYEICDYNVPYQIGLKDAINKGMLVPFHYYGIWDDQVDYSGLRIVRGRYVEAELNQVLNSAGRFELIYKHYRKYGSKRALGFCCSRIHAECMAADFSKRGVPAVAVYSDADGEYSEERQTAIERLKRGEIRVIFSVDMFNEGVDICSVDMVMFLRPTESQTIFLQQLGRGLRRERGKDYLNVLDFIGNYEKAGHAPFLLSGQTYTRGKAAAADQADFDFPDDCIVDFDMRLIDLFREMAKRTGTVKERIREEYLRIKELLGDSVPSRMDLFTHMEDEVYRLCLGHAAMNPFRDYLGFLEEMGDLSEAQRVLYGCVGREFLRVLETTAMSKSYKMPILEAFWNGGEVKMEITEEDVYRSYYAFYHRGANGKDMERDKATKDYKQWDRKRYVSEARKNPVKFLMKSGGGFFVEPEKPELIYESTTSKQDGKLVTHVKITEQPKVMLRLCEEMRSVIEMPGFAAEMEDVLRYRTVDYYWKRYEGNRETLN